MYAFAQHPDFQVVDEPFYAYYLTNTDAEHPGREEILASMSSNWDEVTATFWSRNTESHLFIKNMAHHMIHADLSYLKRCQNILFIRDPQPMIASLTQVLEQPIMRDIGLRKQRQLYDHISELQGRSPIVIDSALLLEDPEGMLKAWLKEMGIPFNHEMLKWPAGPIPEDGCWAKYWYANVHETTGFKPQRKKKREIPKHCENLYAEAKEHYAYLSQFTLKPK